MDPRGRASRSQGAEDHQVSNRRPTAEPCARSIAPAEIIVLVAVWVAKPTHGIVVSAYPPFRVESEPQKWIWCLKNFSDPIFLHPSDLSLPSGTQANFWKIYTKVSVVFFADFYSQYFYCFLGSRTANNVTYERTEGQDHDLTPQL